MAAVFTVVDSIMGYASHKAHLSGAWLIVGMVAPLVTLGAIIALQAWRFGTGLTAVASGFAGELAKHVSTTEGLRAQLTDVQAYVDLVSAISASARDLSRRVTDEGSALDKAALATILRRTCQDVAAAYSRAVGEPTRVCVKQLAEKPGDPARPHVQAICRSDKLTDDDAERWDPVEENTDFDVLFHKRDDVWFSSDIDTYEGYRNTSRRPWKYRSVVVWPVFARTGQSTVQSKSNGYDVAAFLCLDAASPDVFDEERHVPLGWTLADAIGRAFEAHYLTFK